MSYAQLFSLSLCASVAGCASEKQATVTARVHGTSEMRSTILDHLPVGTPLAEAKDFMTREGFMCSVERNGKFGNHDGIDYIYCNREDSVDMWVSTRWQVAIVLQDNRVADVDVSAGAIGP